MNPQHLFCPNIDCPARGQANEGNITVHSQQEKRCQCQICGDTFAVTKGTIFYRLRTDPKTMMCVAGVAGQWLSAAGDCQSLWLRRAHGQSVVAANGSAMRNRPQPCGGLASAGLAACPGRRDQGQSPGWYLLDGAGDDGQDTALAWGCAQPATGFDADSDAGQPDSGAGAVPTVAAGGGRFAQLRQSVSARISDPGAPLRSARPPQILCLAGYRYRAGHQTAFAFRPGHRAAHRPGLLAAEPVLSAANVLTACGETPRPSWALSIPLILSGSTLPFVCACPG